MSISSILNENPEKSKLKKIQLTSLAAGLAIYIVMAMLSMLSGTPTNRIIEGQISFSDAILKDIYWNTSDLGLYRIAQILDYGFMVGYGLFIFSTSLILARKFQKDSLMNKIGVNLAIGGIIAAFLDAFENIFILLTLQDPFGFPPLYAIFQSVFAGPKWIIIAIALLYDVFAYIYSKIHIKNE